VHERDPAPIALANSAPTRAARSAVCEPSVAISTLPYSPAGFARSGLDVRTIRRSHGMLWETRSGTLPARSVRRPPIPTSPTTTRPASPRSASSTIPSAGSARTVFEPTATPAASARALAALTISVDRCMPGSSAYTERNSTRPADVRASPSATRSAIEAVSDPSVPTAIVLYISRAPQKGLITIR
jgi:hypothetical protein